MIRDRHYTCCQEYVPIRSNSEIEIEIGIGYRGFDPDPDFDAG